MLAERIERLKRERNAIILAHNYSLPEVQDVADFVGDSLGLSIQASETDAEVIVFCGVDFMAESAKILSPSKKVILPEEGAKCAMAAMCTPRMIQEMKEKHPGAWVVGYVNSSAECKAEMDVCCTSANAVKVVRSVEVKEVIFVPDSNLGLYVQSQVPEKKVHLWPGFCPTHQAFTAEMVRRAKEEHPGAEVLVHPEARPEVIALADMVGSTEGILRRALSSDTKEFIIVTELGMVHRLEKEAPGKRFYEIPGSVCPTMKMVTLGSIVRSLEELGPEIHLDPGLIERARIPLERMVAIGR
jgi:quinolinate synthase